MKLAILIDGGFFLKRYKTIKGFSNEDEAETVALNLVKYCNAHIKRFNKIRTRYKLSPVELYRIYYYDAKPFDGDALNPITKKTISFKKTETFKTRTTIIKTLKKQRKTALRLGFLKASSKNWIIKPEHTNSIIEGLLKNTDISEEHIVYDFKQKEVDMKIGLDIATLSFKKQVEGILLIAGDSDFIPVAKFARRECIDFILDPMNNCLDPNLFEHIDGLNTIKKMDSVVKKHKTLP